MIRHRGEVSDLLARLEELGVPDDTRSGWWRRIWGGAATPPLSREPEAPRPAVKSADPPPVPDAGLQALAEELGGYYESVHAFWAKNGNKLQTNIARTEQRDGDWDYNDTKDTFVRQMRQLDVHFTHIMLELRKGQEPRTVPLDKVQEETQTIIRLQSIHMIGFESLRTEFSNYMKGLRDVGSVLSNHIQEKVNK
jgi:hypothetical protein